MLHGGKYSVQLEQLVQLVQQFLAKKQLAVLCEVAHNRLAINDIPYHIKTLEKHSETKPEHYKQTVQVSYIQPLKEISNQNVSNFILELTRYTGLLEMYNGVLLLAIYPSVNFSQPIGSLFDTVISV